MACWTRVASVAHIDIGMGVMRCFAFVLFKLAFIVFYIDTGRKGLRCDATSQAAIEAIAGTLAALFFRERFPNSALISNVRDSRAQGN